jgi:hypothetical protein
MSTAGPARGRYSTLELQGIMTPGDGTGTGRIQFLSCDRVKSSSILTIKSSVATASTLDLCKSWNKAAFQSSKWSITSWYSCRNCFIRHSYVKLAPCSVSMGATKADTSKSSSATMTTGGVVEVVAATAAKVEYDDDDDDIRCCFGCCVILRRVAFTKGRRTPTVVASLPTELSSPPFYLQLVRNSNMIKCQGGFAFSRSKNRLFTSNYLLVRVPNPCLSPQKGLTHMITKAVMMVAVGTLGLFPPGLLPLLHCI